jgi:hypothetical protein
MYERDFPSLKDLFNESLLDLIAKVSMGNTTNERIKNKENFYYLIKQMPNIGYLNEETTSKLKRLQLQSNNNLKFNPLKLKAICRQVLVHAFSSRVNLNNCVLKFLPKRIVSFVNYEQEFKDIFEY